MPHADLIACSLPPAQKPVSLTSAIACRIALLVPMVTMHCCRPLPDLLADGCEGRGGGSVAGRKVCTSEDTCRRARGILWHAAGKDSRSNISNLSSRCCISTLTGRPPHGGFAPVVWTVARHTSDLLLVNDWLLYTFTSMSLEPENGQAEEKCATATSLDEMLKYAWTALQVISNVGQRRWYNVLNKAWVTL